MMTPTGASAASASPKSVSSSGGGTYCKFCHHTWKLQKEYDRHLGCCEYFYHRRRNPAPEMDEHGTKIPTGRELFRYVQDLSARLEKTEKEVVRLRQLVNSRQRKAILEWLNQPSQLPACTFEDWWRQCRAGPDAVEKTIHRDLTQGIVECIQSYVAASVGSGLKLPIRCFTQKPGQFYVYSAERSSDTLLQSSTGGGGAAAGAAAATTSTADTAATLLRQPVWRAMTNDQLERMALHLSQSILRAFLTWSEQQQAAKGDSSDPADVDDRMMDKKVLLMMKVNGNGVSIERRLVDIKKWLYPQLEENLRVIASCEFE